MVVAEAHFRVGSGLVEVGMYHRAVTHLLTALAIHPNMAEATFEVANAMRDLGQHDDAVRRYRRALTLVPRDAVGLTGLGYTFHEAGNVPKALRPWTERCVYLYNDITSRMCLKAFMCYI